MTVTGIVLASAAGGVAAYGQYQEGKATRAYYNSLADQNDRQAQMGRDTAEMQATILQNEAAQRNKELAGEVKTVKGTQKATMAAMGLYGVTAEDILEDTTNKANLDAANIRYNADIQSWALKKEANERGWALGNQASLFRTAGKQAKTASYINMTSTLLGTASSIAMAGAKFPTKSPGGTSKIYTGNDFGGFTPSSELKGFNWSPGKIY